MATVPPRIDAALELYRDLVLEDESLSAELETSAVEFFHGPAPFGISEEARLAERRHLEWFLIERHSPGLFGVPVERLAETANARVQDSDLSRGVAAVIESFAGVFVVTEVRTGQGVWVEDVAGFGEYPVSEPDGANVLEVGDLIVGRLFPIGDALYQASPAAGVFRNPELLAALRRDLAEARTRHTAKVLHVSQDQIEVMFFGASQAAPSGEVVRSELEGERSVADPVGEARSLLVGAGLNDADVEELFVQLAHEPFDTSRLMHGARDVLGNILDRLAFDTGVDLERTRGLLQQAWARLSSKSDASVPEPTKPSDQRAAVEAFAQGRARGEDVDKLITDLERDLALDTDPDPDEGELAPAPDFPGVVGAMIDEFLWELGREAPGDVESHNPPLRHLATFAAPIGVFEDLSAAELLRFTTFWLHERQVLESGSESLALLDALDAFCRWTTEAHEMPLEEDFGPTLARLRESLPRIVRANRELARPGEGDAGELFELRAGAGEPTVLVDRAGDAHAVEGGADLAEFLVAGDRLRGRVGADGSVSVFRCYPPESAALMV
ncbi:MAG: hypothetical protein GY711_32420 [bacterium]|nr:hypothetical protein [bacterium]